MHNTQSLHQVGGKWVDSRKTKTIPDPWNGEAFITIPDTQLDEIQPFVDSLKAVPKSGLHNPLKNPERCVVSLIDLCVCPSCRVQCACARAPGLFSMRRGALRTHARSTHGAHHHLAYYILHTKKHTQTQTKQLLAT